jgi:hypothetical protein
MSEFGEGHFGVEEDQTTLSADSPKPCQPNVIRRSSRAPRRNLAPPEKASDQGRNGVERVPERAADTGLSVRRKGWVGESRS